MVEQRKPTFWQWLSGMPDYPEWEDYKKEGGHLRYDKWKAQGKPSPLGTLTPYAQYLTTTPEYAARKELMARGGVLSGLEQRKVQEALDEATKGEGVPTPAPEGWEDYWDEGGYFWKWDKGTGTPYKARFDPSKVYIPSETKLQKAQRERAEAETGQVGKAQAPWMYDPYGESPYDIPTTEEVEGQWNPYTGKWEQPPGYISPAERERMNLERDVFNWQQQVSQQELDAEKGRQLAQLLANPASWIEYAVAKKEIPAIQPWMLPLMPQQYAGLQAGEAIPGYQAGGQTMNLPGLTTPSAQYMSRLAPSKRQEYYGYEQARTGARPEDVDWRLWSQAPPGGRYPGLRQTRKG